MAATTSSYSITMRLHTAPDHGVVGARRHRDRRRPAASSPRSTSRSRSHDRLVVDVTCSASDAEHAAASSRGGRRRRRASTVHKVSDRTFLLHLGGKIEVTSKVPLRNRDDLSMAYTPGVGRVCMAIAEQPRGRRAG